MLDGLLLVVEEGGVGNGAVEVVPYGILAFSGGDRPFGFVEPCVISVVCCSLSEFFITHGVQRDTLAAASVSLAMFLGSMPSELISFDLDLGVASQATFSLID